MWSQTQRAKMEVNSWGHGRWFWTMLWQKSSSSSESFFLWKKKKICLSLKDFSLFNLGLTGRIIKITLGTIRCLEASIWSKSHPSVFELNSQINMEKLLLSVFIIDFLFSYSLLSKQWCYTICQRHKPETQQRMELNVPTLSWNNSKVVTVWKWWMRLKLSFSDCIF